MDIIINFLKAVYYLCIHFLLGLSIILISIYNAKIVILVTQLSHMETSTKPFKLQGRSEIKYTT